MMTGTGSSTGGATVPTLDWPATVVIEWWTAGAVTVTGCEIPTGGGGFGGGAG